MTVGEPPDRPCRTARQVEEAARDWIRYWGYPDAQLTRSGPDGGVDVEGRAVVAQVKAEAVPTGRPVVQALTGIASVRNAQGMVFSWAGFTNHAIEFADQARVCLFQIDMLGRPEPIGRHATGLVAARAGRHPAEALPELTASLTVPVAVGETMQMGTFVDPEHAASMMAQLAAWDAWEDLDSVWYMQSLAASLDVKQPGRRVAFRNRVTLGEASAVDVEILLYRAGSTFETGSFVVYAGPEEMVEMLGWTLEARGMPGFAELEVPATEQHTLGAIRAVDLSAIPEHDALWALYEPGSGLWHLFDGILLPDGLSVDDQIVHALSAAYPRQGG